MKDESHILHEATQFLKLCYDLASQCVLTFDFQFSKSHEAELKPIVKIHSVNEFEVGLASINLTYLDNEFKSDQIKSLIKAFALIILLTPNSMVESNTFKSFNFKLNHHFNRHHRIIEFHHLN